MTVEAIAVDGRTYRVEVQRRVQQPETAPRLAVVAYQPNPTARQVLEVCLESIEKMTASPYELWVIDNHSPAENTAWLLERPGINLIINHTEPVYPAGRDLLIWLKVRLRGQKRHPYTASYANAIALELAVRLISPQSHSLMPLHMDTLACHPGWLDFLKGKLDDGYAAAGVRRANQHSPEETLHVLGYLVNFQLFRAMQLDFLPRLPRYDAGDLVTVRLKQAGERIYTCRNTLWEPELEQNIPASSPLRDFHVDRAFDDAGSVIFLHLGRGIRKALNIHGRGVTAEEWVTFARKHLLR
ncbi:MAG: hypothetical protein AB1894_19195 [Chloroflexota bacterium]